MRCLLALQVSNLHHANKAVMLDMAAPVLLVLKGKASTANTAVSLTAII